MSRPELRGGPLQAGVGMGWRPELAGGLMTAPQQVDWLEVVAESCMAPGPTRREILQIHLRRIPTQPGCALEPLVALTAGRSGADLAAICQVAGRAALRRCIAHAEASAAPPPDTAAVVVTADDLLAAAHQVIAAGSRGTSGAAERS